MKYTSRIMAMGLAMGLAMCLYFTSFAQPGEAEVPGDQFSLEGALELFKKSQSPEQFENLLNSPEEKVNNLDLNGDGYTDYIRVFDRQDGNVHVFILQAVISDSESQDVAVIELEKLSNGKAVLQIIGDEDIYGVETIIEPTREVRTYAGTNTTRTTVNVWEWPVVYYVYSPYYTVWSSPWAYHNRPNWWRPWRPVVYVTYYDYWRPYRPHYNYCHAHRAVYAHDIYRPYRTTSVFVHNRHHHEVDRYRASHHDHDNNRYGHRSSRSSEHERQGDNHESRFTNSDGSRQQSNSNRDSFTSRERSKSHVNRSFADDEKSISLPNDRNVSHARDGVSQQSHDRQQRSNTGRLTDSYSSRSERQDNNQQREHTSIDRQRGSRSNFNGGQLIQPRQETQRRNNTIQRTENRKPERSNGQSSTIERRGSSRSSEVKKLRN